MAYCTLAESLSPDSIETDLKSTEKQAVLEEMVTLLEKTGKITNKTDVLNALTNREKIATTAISNGIAMPHVKTDSVSCICMAIGISHSGINYGAQDKSLTKIIILAVSPNDPTSSYLTALVNLLEELKTQKVCNELLSCKTKKDVFELLLKYEHKMFTIEQASI